MTATASGTHQRVQVVANLGELGAVPAELPVTFTFKWYGSLVEAQPPNVPDVYALATKAKLFAISQGLIDAVFDFPIDPREPKTPS